MRKKRLQSIIVLSAAVLAFSAAPVLAAPETNSNSVSSSSVDYDAQEKAVTGDTATPEGVMNMIDKLPSYDKLTLTSEKAVDDIYNMYLRLSDADKKKVLNIDALFKMQDKLEKIHEQARYTYLFNMTDSKRSAMINITYALVSSADGQNTNQGTNTATELANTDIDLLFESPDGESFTINQSTKKLDRKDIHLTCSWQGADVQIKISDCELGSWLVKAPVPISMAVQSYADSAAMEHAADGAAVSVDEQSNADEEAVETTSNDNNPNTVDATEDSNGSGNLIGMFVSIVVLIGGFAAFVHIRKKKRTQATSGAKDDKKKALPTKNVSAVQNDEEEDDPEKEQKRLMRIMEEEEKKNNPYTEEWNTSKNKETEKKSSEPQMTEDDDPDIEIIDDSDNDISHEEVDEHPAENDETIERRNDFFTKKNRFS